MGVRDRVQKMLGGPDQQIGGRTVEDIIAVTEQAMQDQSMVNEAFAPGEPIRPYDGYSRTPRSKDFQTGYNISSRPRLNEQVSFSTLKALVKAYDVAEMCIWHRIDSIRSLEYMLIPAKGFTGDAAPYIARAEEFLKKPDGEHAFNTWIASYLHDVLGYDAGTLYKMRNVAGRAVGLRVLDGTMIAPMLDYWGNRPTGNAPAYVQFAQGVPWEWLSDDDIIYEPFRPQTDSPYGRSPIETILINANTDLRFQQFFLNYFTEGNIPEGFAGAPENWTPGQIEEFQETWDALLYGDDTRKHQIRWIPHGTTVQWAKDAKFDGSFPEFLMRKTCAAYHVQPQDIGFTMDVNRATGETQQDVQARVGEGPLLKHLNGIFTRFLQDDLYLPVEFKYNTGREVEDRVATAAANKIYIESGVVSPSEVREEVFGLGEPDNVPVPRFIFSNRSGPIPLSALAAVAGPIDKDTAAPAPGEPLPHQPFQPIEGVAPATMKPRPALAIQQYPDENSEDTDPNAPAVGGQLPVDPTTPPTPYPAGPPQVLPQSVGKSGAGAGVTVGGGTVAPSTPMMLDGTRRKSDDELDEEAGTHIPGVESQYPDREVPAYESSTGGADQASGVKAGTKAGEPGPSSRRGKSGGVEKAGINTGTTSGGNPLIGGMSYSVATSNTNLGVRSPDPTDETLYSWDDNPFRMVGLGIDGHSSVTQGQAAELVKAALDEVRVFQNFVKNAKRRGKWRDFAFAFQPSSADAAALNAAGRAFVEKTTDAGDEPVPDGAPPKVNVAGLCVKALDTGRVLMLQRGLTYTDPAAGKWEFPGGHVEDGENHRDAAIREWQEETGMRFPADAEPYAMWVEENGYTGFCYRIHEEAELADQMNQRTHFIPNPDDPTSDLIETCAWWNPADIKDNPAVRKELRESAKRCLRAIYSDGVATMAKASEPSKWAMQATRKVDGAVDHHADAVREGMRSLVDRSKLRDAIGDYLRDQ